MPIMTTENYVGHAAHGSSIHDDVLTAFVSAMPSKDTKKEYLIRLRYFFDAIHVPGKTLADQASNFLSQIAAANQANSNPKYGQDCLQKFKGYLKERFERRELSSGSVKNYLFAPKLFYEVNDIEFDWKKIRRGLPRANYVAHDRNPTIEEIRKLIAYPDRRVKVIVLTIISSGIRVGAFDYLKWKQ
jgi:hypothetical protein